MAPALIMLRCACLARMLCLLPAPQDRGLPRNDVYFVDIGANVGSFTLGVAAYGFSVLAVEPMHANALALRHSMCINPHLKVNITLLHHVSCRGGVWRLLHVLSNSPPQGQ